MTVWVRFLELPIEFYDASVLKEIGSVTGPILRIDSYTTSKTRGGYARLCVQIDLDKPLINSIWVGRLIQKVLYEGISSLYFCCGKLGHKQESCGLKVRKPSGVDEAQVSLKTNEISEEVQPEPNYGPWMVVIRKRGTVRMGKASGPSKFDNPSQVRTRGNSDFPQVSMHLEAGEDFDKSNPSDISPSDSTTSREVTTHVVAAQNLQSDLANSKEETTHVVITQNPKINLEMRKDCVMED